MKRLDNWLEGMINNYEKELKNNAEKCIDCKPSLVVSYHQYTVWIKDEIIPCCDKMKKALHNNEIVVYEVKNSPKIDVVITSKIGAGKIIESCPYCEATIIFKRV